ncbi:MAG: hypothetical protein ACC663_08400 [Gammaproteobacteria bacterium]
MKKLLFFFAAGCVGGLAYGLSVWILGRSGITSAFGVSIHASLTPAWFYPRIVWGGIWGMLFILSISNSSLLWKGTVLSLIPSAVQLFVVYPLIDNRGIAGFELGLLTPLLVLFFNWVWGVATALTIKIAD